MNHELSHHRLSIHNTEPPPFWRSRYAIGLLVMGAAAAHGRPAMNHDVPAYGLWALVVLNSTIFVMFPILLVMYGRLGMTEEAEMRKQFGTDFDACAARTPRFLPSLRRLGAGPS